MQVQRNDSRSVQANQTLSIGKDLTVTVGKNVRIEAGDSLELVVGQARLLMKKDGSIVIKGRDIRIDASGTVDVKSSKDVKLAGHKIGQN